MKVLFLDVVHEVLEQKLEEKGFICADGTRKSLAELENDLAEAEGLVIRSRFTIDETFLKSTPKLQFIARSGAGMENIDVSACEKRGIHLFNAPEGNRNAVGEHALGMLLALLNKLHTADRDVKKGLWEREANRGEELDGKTVGIIGFGNNGSAFAKKLQGFDVRILAYDKYKTGFSSEHVQEATMAELFEQADIVSFHIPQNEETLFLANTSFFTAFAKPTYLLNLSRGKIVETQALVAALDAGRVKGAGLDVLEFEKTSFENLFDKTLPSAFAKLLKRDDVILSPHVGGWTTESYRKLSEVLAKKIITCFPSK